MVQLCARFTREKAVLVLAGMGLMVSDPIPASSPSCGDQFWWLSQWECSAPQQLRVQECPFQPGRGQEEPHSLSQRCKIIWNKGAGFLGPGFGKGNGPKGGCSHGQLGWEAQGMKRGKGKAASAASNPPVIPAPLPAPCRATAVTPSPFTSVPAGLSCSWHTPPAIPSPDLQLQLQD